MSNDLIKRIQQLQDALITTEASARETWTKINETLGILRGYFFPMIKEVKENNISRAEVYLKSIKTTVDMNKITASLSNLLQNYSRFQKKIRRNIFSFRG